MQPSGCSNFTPPLPKQLGPYCPGSRCVGDPFQITTGNLYETATDFSTVGADALAFIRYYNSQSQRASSLGIGWRSNYDSSIDFLGQSPATATTLVVVLPAGAEYRFHQVSGSWVSNDTDVDGALATDGSTAWTFTDSNDEIYTYDFTTGRLTSIKSRSGYQQNLAYDSNGNLLSVTDSFNRTLSFGFLNGVLHTLTDPDGNVFTYDYNTLHDDTNPNQLAKVTFPTATNPFVQYVYEDPNYVFSLTGIVDENQARYATWSYDAQMHVASSSLAGGADATAASYNLNSSGAGTVTITNALGKVFVYTLSYLTGVGKITEIDEQASPNTQAATVLMGYDSNGYLNSLTDENANLTQYQNDSRGEITSETDGVGSSVQRTITTQWDPTYHVPAQVDYPNLLRTNFYYTGGLLTQLTERDETTQSIPYSTNGQTRTWSFGYWPSGLLHTVDGPLAGTADTVTYAYNANGFVNSVTDELGHITQITAWNGRGEPLTSIDPNNITTQYTYDALGRIKTLTVNPGASQALTSIGYDNAGNVKTVATPDGLTLTYNYDDAHRLSSVVDNLNETITYTRDAMGDVTQETIKSSAGTIVKSQTATFDELGRVLKNIGAAAQTTQHAYDKNGNEIQTTDPRNMVYAHAFDALNRLYQETDANLNTTTANYNFKDEIVSVADARSLTTSYVRDGFGDAIQQASPDTGTTVYYYDALGDVTEKLDSRGVETDYTYDAKGRIKTRKIHGTTAENVTFTYDNAATNGIDRLRKIADPSGSTTFNYGPLGYVTKEVRVVQANTYNVTFVNNPAGHPLTITYPSGRIVTYTRDSMGRISGITTKQSAGAPVVTIASSTGYQPFGPLAGFTFGNGLVLSLAYDQDYQLTGIVAANGATTVQNLTYGYDPAGNVSPITDNLNAARTQSFTYSNINRLKTAAGAYGAQSYSYDHVANRLSRTVGGVTDTYAISPTSNQINTVTTGSNVRSFSYLPTGQVQNDTRDPAHAYVYGYNQTGRLASVTLNGATAGTYLVNGLEQRVAKTVGSTTTHFIFDRLGHLLAEADGATGATQKEYIWLDDLPVAMVDDTGASPVITYIHTDHLGTPQKVTDASMNLVWDGVFDPFGNPSSITGSATMNLRFPGQYFDAETGLAQNWNRDYDPTIGRYVESDPIGLLGGINTYVYVDGNPLRRTDRDGKGLLGCIVGGTIGGLIGGGGGTLVEPGGGTIIGGIGGAEEGCDIGSGAETALQLMQMASTVTKKKKECLDESNCEALLQIDTNTCNAITRMRGRRAGAICHQSKWPRYAACLRGQPLPPLSTWNN
jgi:RHS repeat-associated protein